YAYNHVCRSTFCREDHGCNLCCDRFDVVAVFPACQFDRFNGRWPRQSPRSNWWPDFGLFAPIFYGVLGFVFGAIGAFLYNFMAKWLGGIEVQVQPAGPPASSASVSTA